MKKSDNLNKRQIKKVLGRVEIKIKVLHSTIHYNGLS